MRVKSGAANAEEVEAIQAGAEPASASICLRVILKFSYPVTGYAVPKGQRSLSPYLGCPAW